MTVPRALGYFAIVALFPLAACAARGKAARSLPARLAITDSVAHLDALAREPMVVEHPNGTLFVSGYSDPDPKLWKSADRGRSWKRVDVGGTSEGAIGNSDVDLSIAPDGTLYFVTMGFDRNVGEGTHVALGVSSDAGVTWSWRMLSKTRFDDRPWVRAAPGGAVHVIWNDGKGVRHTVSRDRGATWKEQPRIHPSGGSSHFAVGLNGDLAVRITPRSASGNQYDEGVDLIAVSVDGGVTWSKYLAPGMRDWTEPTPRWVEPLAWDASGALFSLWTSGREVWVARSRNRGATWTQTRVVESGDEAYYPYVVARGAGELAATWFSGRGDDLKAHVARIDVSDNVARVVESPALHPNSWGLSSRRENPEVRNPAGEYLPIVFLLDGTLGVASTIQNERAKQFGFTWWRIAPSSSR